MKINFGRIKNKPQFIAICLTAISALPVWQAFGEIPIILCAVCLLGIGYIIAGGSLSNAFPLTLPVYAISTCFFGFFAMFQVWRIMTAVVIWLDKILTNFFNWIG